MNHDIVERLRCFGYGTTNPEVCKEAADTIESLRARVAELESSPTMAAVRKTVESKVADENTRLYQRIAELEEQLETEQARGIHSCHPGCLRDGCVNRRLRDQLAAQALRIKTMRAVLENFIDSHEECTDLDGFTAQIVSMDDYHEAQEPLSLPDNSTEILQEWLDKQLGEPVTWYDGETFYANEESASMCCADMDNLIPLYRKPEIK